MTGHVAEQASSPHDSQEEKRKAIKGRDPTPPVRVPPCDLASLVSPKSLGLGAMTLTQGTLGTFMIQWITSSH